MGASCAVQRAEEDGARHEDRSNGMSGEASCGKYRLVAELGHGGMADVFLAIVEGPRGLGFAKLVVIKRLRPNLVDDPEFTSMLIDEARLAARLNHPNVVQTLEVGEASGHYYIAMEFLDGQPLQRIHHRAAARGGFDARLTYGIVLDVLDGLHYAHELVDYDGTSLRVVHRDVSPHNVFVTFDGVSKIVDFGIAKAVGRAAETRTGIIKGKVTYMAPEQARCGVVDRRADIFSVGVMLWEAATGVRMWKGLGDMAIMNRLVTGDIPSPSSQRPPHISPRFAAMCDRALAVDPEKRYATAEELRHDLEEFIRAEGLRVHARDIGARVTELYEERRKQIRSSVEACLAQLKAHPERQDLPRLSPDAMSIPEATAPALFATDSTGATVIAREGGSEASRRPLRTRRNRAAIWLLGMATASVSTGLLSVPALPLIETAPMSSVQAESDAPATSMITITLRAKPLESRFSIDDGAPLENPYLVKMPTDGLTHRIRVWAPGYLEQSRAVAFRDDLLVDIALEKDSESGAPSRSADKRAGPVPAAARAPGGAKPKRVLDTQSPW
jgi:serine/threonine-protein kinase